MIITNKSFLFTLFHLLLLSSLTYKNIPTTSLYSICTTTVNIPLLHLLHILFILNLIYQILQLTLKIISPLTNQELNLINDNLFLFLTDILLVLSVFNKDINFRNIVLFFVILCFKILIWACNSRIEYEVSKKLCWLSGVISFLCFLFAVMFLRTQSYIMYLLGFKNGVYLNSSYGSSSSASSYGSSSSGYSSASSNAFSSSSSSTYGTPNAYNTTINILFLFSFEFCLIALNALKNLYVCLVKLKPTNKTLRLFYIELTYLSTLLCLYTTFILITTLKFKIPIHLFRSTISILDKLLKKWKLFTKYKTICSELESIPDTEVNVECPICTDEIIKGKKLRCGHIFHIECLKMWCERQYFCPICKVDLSINSKKESIISGNEVLTGVAVIIERD